MSERFKVVLDHAKRYTSAQLYLYLYPVAFFIMKAGFTARTMHLLSEGGQTLSSLTEQVVLHS